MSEMGSLASQQLMEEELQQSARENEDNADYDSQEDAPGEEDPDAEGEEVEEEDSGGTEEVDAEGEEVDGEADSSEGSEASSDEDAEGQEDQSEDAEGESEEEAEVSKVKGKAIQEDSEEEEDDEEEEGVGAVKLRPGDTDEEEEEDSDADEASEAEISTINSQDDEEDEGQWDKAVAQDEDGDESEEADSANVCMFCKQDEDNDPAEEFEVFLTCNGCGECGHQQCARDNDALEGKRNSKSWLCPDCVAGSGAGDGRETSEGVDLDNFTNDDAPPASRRATAPKLARDLLPSQRGAVKPDSHSVFNQLVLDGDPMDGSRILRKRKTSSIEGGEEIINHLRKRRKNTGDGQSIDIEDPSHINGPDEDNRPRSARSLRLKISTNAPATIVKKSRTSLVLRFRVAPAELKKITSRKPKPRKGRTARRGAGSRATAARARGRQRADTPPIAPFAASVSQPFYSFFDKDMDDKGKPYGGVLTEAQADTSKTLPSTEDRRRFDEAKQKAEDDWKEKILKVQAEVDAPVRKAKKSAGPASQIECIEFGGWEIDTWYAAPYPEEYSRNRVLFICEFCLKYMNSDYVAWRHKLKCPAKHPPGDEIYRNGSISVFEVDGRKNPVYCQNLCLLAKLFLGSKTLYYDVEPFLFYVLCEYDDLGYHFVGYFSKEKRASSQNNVSCILTLPIHQRKGYGNLLIDFSYLLTKVEGKNGSPEKPLSDMGLVSYRNYWRLVMCRYLISCVPRDRHEKKGLSIKLISDDTGMTADDVISALEGLRCLVRDPQSQLYAFRVDTEFCREYVAKWESKNYVQLDPSALAWTPYVMGRGNATQFELAPAMHAIAPREEDEEHKANDIVIAEVVAVNGETVQVPIATTNGIEPSADAEADAVANATILESTEPNEKCDNDIAVEDHPAEAVEAVKAAVNGEAGTERGPVGAAEGSHDNKVPIEHGGVAVPNTTEQEPKVDSDEDKENSWMVAYDNIPPTRFTVYPPTHGGRRIPNRPPATPRPPVSRTASTTRPTRPKPRRAPAAASSSRKARSSSARNRKPGGTGRGPGRWPKGTKKSDYGNAESGPGLPPSWKARQDKRKAEGLPEEHASAAAVQAVEDEADEAAGKSPSKKVNGAGGDADGDVDMKVAEAVEA